MPGTGIVVPMTLRYRATTWSYSRRPDWIGTPGCSRSRAPLRRGSLAIISLEPGGRSVDGAQRVAKREQIVPQGRPAESRGATGSTTVPWTWRRGLHAATKRSRINKLHDSVPTSM